MASNLPDGFVMDAAPTLGPSAAPAPLPQGFQLDQPPSTPIPANDGPVTPRSIADDIVAREKAAQTDTESSSRAGAFARGAERGALPAAGGIAGAGLGMATVAPLAAGAAAVPVVGPALGAATELGGAVVGGFGGAAAIGAAQKWVLDHAPDGVVKALGLDKAQQQADQADHPNYEFAGELAPNLAAFRPGALAADVEGFTGKTAAQKLMSNPVTARALPAAVMGAQEAANEEIQTGDVDPTKIAIAAGVGALSNKMTKVGDFLTGAGAGPVLGLQAALRNRGQGGEPDASTMRDITPEKSGPAPAGTPQIAAPIDPQDLQPGDAESPIPTSIIAAGRAKMREALSPEPQAPDNPDVLAKNGWPQAGTPVSIEKDGFPPLTGTVHSGFNFTVPDATGATGEGMHISLDTGDMVKAFKSEIDAAGITITPQQAQQAGLPLDIASQPAPAGQPQAPAAASVPVAPMAAPEAAPVQTAPASQGIPVDLFHAPTATSEPITPSQASPPPDVLQTSVQSAAELANVPTTAVQPISAPAAVAPPAIGDGTQAAPIEVTHPDHVEQASELVNTTPSEAQVGAGNYQKLHLKVQGLPITIENPKGSIRSGTDADGTPWSVKLPAAYGYIKRSTAADGEQVDAYVGPNPQSSKVFVIDQKDAKTGAYDEAKSFIGFDTKQQALDTYHAAFSDGLGPQRMGGIREMNTVQFKQLLNSGVLDKPVAGAKLPAVAETSPPPETSAAQNLAAQDKQITALPPGITPAMVAARARLQAQIDAANAPPKPAFQHRDEFAAEPGTAVDGKGNAVPQTVIPGAERDAVQLAKAREAAGQGKSTTSVKQKSAGGLFGGDGPPEPEQGALFHHGEGQSAPVEGVREPIHPTVNLVFSKGATAQRSALASEMRAWLDKRNLQAVGVRVANAIENMGEGGRHEDGVFLAKIINLALDAKDPASVMTHEVIHALRRMGFINKSEWAILAREAQAKWLDRYADKRKGYDDAEKIEESVAFAHQEWASGRPTRFAILNRIFSFLRDTLDKIRSAFQGRGLHTPEDVFGADARHIFENIERGEVGARGPGFDRRSETPAFQHRAESEPTDEHQVALDQAWDATISATAKKLGWEGEPTSRAIYLKGMFMPKGAASSEMARKAGIIKALEDQRDKVGASPLTPIKGDGETKVRGAAQGAADMAAKSGHTIEDLPTYDASKQIPLMEKARKFTDIDANFEQAKAVAMGEEPAPYGQNAVSIRIAVEERLAREGQWDLLNRVTKQSKLNEAATTSGQNNAMYAQRDPDSAAAAIQEVQRARAPAAKAPDSARKAKSDAVKDMLSAIKKETTSGSLGAKKLNLRAFAHAIACKE